MLISIIIRTHNQAHLLTDVVEAVFNQQKDGHEVEVIVADANSTDGTAFIAEFLKCQVIHFESSIHPITALNRSCTEAKGEILVFLSPESVPCSKRWLKKLIEPLIDEVADYSYGRLVASCRSPFSRQQYLETHFSANSQVPQYETYCNNANAAINKSTWKRFRFDESLNAFEEIQMLKDINQSGRHIAYIAEAEVFDLRHESFKNSMQRHRDEAESLQKIYPDIHFGLMDFCWYWLLAITNDTKQAFKAHCLHNNLYQIIAERFAEYWGAYLGHSFHRKKSGRIKERFFNPKNSDKPQ